MGIRNETKKLHPFSENNNFIEKLTFPYVLHKAIHHYTRAGFSNSWSVMLYNDTISTNILAAYLSDYISAKAII